VPLEKNSPIINNPDLILEKAYLLKTIQCHSTNEQATY
jgi:hypothetical protein